MGTETRDWTVPAPLSALLWWPAVSFVLVLVAPDAAIGSIAMAGLALVALGAVASRLRRRPSEVEAGTAPVTEQARAA